MQVVTLHISTKIILLNLLFNTCPDQTFKLGVTSIGVEIHCWFFCMVLIMRCLFCFYLQHFHCNVTHVVCGKLSRSEKFLGALTLGMIEQKSEIFMYYYSTSLVLHPNTWQLDQSRISAWAYIVKLITTSSSKTSVLRHFCHCYVFRH